MEVAFLGTGLMGLPMATRLLHGGHRLAVYNRTPAKTRVLAQQGAVVHDTPAAAVAAGRWVVMMLTDAAAIDATLLSPPSLGLLRDRRVLNLGTIAPHQARELGARVGRAGGQFMECPVLGSVTEAGDGNLILMFGGTADQFRDALPLLQCWGAAPLHVGEVGQGAALKLGMNQLIAALTAGFAVSLAMAREENIPVDTFMKVVRDSALYAPTFDKKLPRLLECNFERPNFPLKHLLKDVRLIKDTAAGHGLDVRVLAAVQSPLEAAMDRHLGESDYAALYEVIHPRHP